jgi:predicted small lipoprotein YifL
MKNKSIVLIMILALMLTLTACGKSEFGLSENDGKHMTITARNADRDAFFMVGSLDVEDGEQIEIAANLTKGSVRVEIVAGAGGQDINVLPEMDGTAILTADLVRTDSASGTVPAGLYYLRATCLERATGTIQINVTPAETNAPEQSASSVLPEEEQRRILEENRGLWAFDEGEYAPDWYYAFTDLDHNGLLEVLSASTQGSGIFTYAHFYEVLPDGSGVRNLYHADGEIASAASASAASR